MESRHSNLGSRRVVRIRELCKLLQISRTTAWRWEKNGHLPPSRRIGPNVKGWCLKDIEAFFESTDPVEMVEAEKPVQKVRYER